MKNGRPLKILFSSLYLFVFSCSDNDLIKPANGDTESEVQEVPIEIQGPILEYVNGNDVPEIMDELIQRTGANKSVALQKKLSFNETEIDLESIMQVWDDDKGTSYSFGLNVKNKPNDIYNLILQRDLNGNRLEPYVIGYKLDKKDMANFLVHGDDYRKFKAKYRYYAFDRFFKDSKNNSVGKNGDCENGTVGNESGGPETPPGGTFNHSFNGTTVTSTFGYQTGIVPYSYAISINSNGQVSTVSTMATSGVVTIATTGPTTSGMQNYIPPGTVQESIGIDGQPDGGPGSPCLHRITIHDSGVVEFDPCINNQNTQKGSRVAKSGDCPYGNGTVGINTAAKPVQKLHYYYNGALTSAQVNWLSDNVATAKQIVYFLLDNGKSNDVMAQGLKIINSGVKGSLLNVAPFVQYPEGSDYETRYPKLTAYLKNELPKVADNNKVVDAIHDLTEAPKETIREALKWGKGPEIRIENLSGLGNDQRLGSYRGHNQPGLVNVLFLDEDLVDAFENSQETELSDAMAFLIAVTILHEYVHLGDNVFGNSFWGDLWLESGFEDENEAGLLFEEMVFGDKVFISNAGVILKRTGGL